MVVSSIEHEICSVMVQVLIQEDGEPAIKTEPLPKRHISASLVYGGTPCCQGVKPNNWSWPRKMDLPLGFARWMIRGAYLKKHIPSGWNSTRNGRCWDYSIGYKSPNLIRSGCFSNLKKNTAASQTWILKSAAWFQVSGVGLFGLMNPSAWKVQTCECPGGHYESVNETHIPRTTTWSVLFVLQIVTQGNHTPSHSLLRKGVNVHDFSLVRTGLNQVQQDYQVDSMGFYYESIPCPKQSESRHPFGWVRRMG